jgi:hypothetical protein
MGIIDSMRSQGERLVGQVTSELMNNPRFVQAVQAAMKGKERLDDAAGRALKSMNVPTRSEFKRMQARLDALEVELQQVRAELRAAAEPPARGRVPGRGSRAAGRGRRKTNRTGNGVAGE